MSQQMLDKHHLLIDAVFEPLTRGDRILQDRVTFQWQEGQHWCITGPTASGKTTLLKLLSGQIFNPTASVFYPLIDKWKSENTSRKYVADWLVFVPQEVSIPTVYIEDLYYQRRFQSAEQEGIPTVRTILMQLSSKDTRLVEEVVSRVKLTQMQDQPFVQLSNGQTRRLMIAIALIKQPKILFMDNPFAGLDQNARNEIVGLLKELSSNGIHICMAALEHETTSLDFITNRLVLQSEVHHAPGLFPEAFKADKSDEKAIIRFHNASVRYGEKIVFQDFNWQVHSGEHWVIKGTNGSGKSTLLSMITADHPQAYSCNLMLFGKQRGSGESIWDIKSNIGYFSPEMMRFFESSGTVRKVILSGLEDLYAEKSSPHNSLITDLLSWIGVEEWEDRLYAHLSFGEKRIVLLLRAIIRRNELLILDEPLQGLDLFWREKLKSAISVYCQNRTLLYITHDEDEIPEGDWKYLQL